MSRTRPVIVSTRFSERELRAIERFMEIAHIDTRQALVHAAVLSYLRSVDPQLIAQATQ